MGLFSQVFMVQLSWYYYVILGASIWLAYTGDRWLDVRQLDLKQVMTERHRFSIKKHRTISVFWLLILAATVALACLKLSARDFLHGCILLTGCTLYTFGAQASRKWLPKEALVALLFSAGALLFIYDRATLGIPVLFNVYIAFVLLCYANCVLIAKWERNVDKAHSQPSIFKRWPRLSAYARWLPLLAVFSSLPIAFNDAVPAYGKFALVFSFTLAGAGLLFLDKLSGRLSRENLRVCADAVFLSPLIALALGMLAGT